MSEEIKAHLEDTVYKLATEVACEGWALEREYQLLKNWAQTIVTEHNGDWNLLCGIICPRIYDLLEVRA